VRKAAVDRGKVEKEVSSCMGRAEQGMRSGAPVALEWRRTSSLRHLLEDLYL